MKTKHWMFAAALVAGLAVSPALWGQPSSNPTPAPPAPGETPALIPAEALPPAATDKSKKNAAKTKPAAPNGKKSASSKKTTAPSDSQESASLIHPGPAIVKQNNVNVRGQATITSEVLLRLKRGDQVMVLEEVTLKKPREDEPAHWARIALSTNVATWVHSMFIDADSKTVKPKRLNLRSGPGENFSVLGHIEKGTTVQEIETKGEWIRIESPNSAFGFVAAHLLTNTAAPLLVANTPPPPPPKPVETVLPAEPVITPPPAVAPPTPPPAPAPTLVETKTEEPKPAPPVIAAPPPPPPVPVVEEPPPKRVVSREGYVRDTISIQAPTYFRLESLDTHKTINYIYSPDTNVVLRDFNGKRIIVTGEELLDERWPHTPVITVDTIKEAP
jgi:uncharacterized protein YgiM (DUF1202 family)